MHASTAHLSTYRVCTRGVGSLGHGSPHIPKALYRYRRRGFDLTSLLCAGLSRAGSSLAVCYCSNQCARYFDQCTGSSAHLYRIFRRHASVRDSYGDWFMTKNDFLRVFNSMGTASRQVRLVPPRVSPSACRCVCVIIRVDFPSDLCVAPTQTELLSFTGTRPHCFPHASRARSQHCPAQFLGVRSF